jgi:GNAT superfamily N-acetyltransferase
MIDTRLIELVPATDDDREFSYQVKKAAEGVYISRIWGWDESFQRKFHETDWNENRPDIIKYSGKSIGTLSVVENDRYIQVGRFFILPEYQRKGIGSYLLRTVLQKADKAGLVSRVAFLKGNPVESLYTRNGFHLVDEQGQYIFMERNPH